MFALELSGVEVVFSIGAIGLIVIGLAGLMMYKNLFRMVLALVLLESGVNLLLILSGFKDLGVAPIFTADQLAAGTQVVMNDPIPQALVLTAIVIGVGVQALALALIIRIKDAYQSLDMDEIRQMAENEISDQLKIPGAISRDTPQECLKNNQALGDSTHG